MQQLATIWNGLDWRKRIVAGGAALGVFLAVLALARMAAAPNMALLYSGLDPAPAGEVLRALEQRGVRHDIRGGAIFVPASERDALRMGLASEGLPAGGPAGYEILDGLSGFGTTSQMFDAAYWRAKEGELARTLLASAQVTAARVHIARDARRPFSGPDAPGASVYLTAAGGGVSPDLAQAARVLVSSAVSGLSAQDVTVIDGTGKVVGDTGAGQALAPVSEQADALRQKVLRLLENRVGAGNVAVEVSVETVTEVETLRERSFDPQSRVAISTDTEERTETARGTEGGSVTVASNLPDGEAAEGNQSSRQNSETRERVNYEVSQTEREITRAPGAIRRLTVAVLINAETGSLEPPEMDAMRDLAASAVGLNESRGDTLTLAAMPFEPVEAAGTPAEAGLMARMAPDPMTLINLGVLAAVALLLGLFVLRPILARPSRDIALPAPAAPAAEPDTGTALSGEIDGDHPDPGSLMVVGDDAAPRSGAGQASDPVERLRLLIENRREESVAILHDWLDAREERAR